MSIYARNFDLDPSSYYNITQVHRHINDIRFINHNLVPNFIYTFTNNKIWKKKPFSYLRLVLLAIITWPRVVWFVLLDKYIYKPDKVYINREVFPRFAPPIAFAIYQSYLKKQCIIWNFDDDILNGKEISRKEYALLLKYSSIIAAQNKYLQSTIPQEFAHKLVNPADKLVADGDVDVSKLDEYTITRHSLYEKEFRLVWLGSASGLQFISGIVPYLDTAAIKLKELNKQLVLYIVSDKPLILGTEALQIINIKWTRKAAVEALYQAHAGLMPLPDTPANRGKSAYKITQYKTAGIPSIASDLPVHREKLKIGDGLIIDPNNEAQNWCDSILKIATDVDYWNKLCQLARLDTRTNFMSITDKAIYLTSCYDSAVLQK